MNRLNHRVVILLSISLLIIGACAGAGNSLDATSWTLESYRDSSGIMVDILPRSTTTALFQSEQVSGSAGCNNYSAYYEVDGSKISFDPPATTKKVCPTPPGIMGQENDFLDALSLVERYDISGDTLEMDDDGGDTLLVFRSSTSG